MTLHKGYYSIVQYCPDLSRLEGTNVGVLLFCPEPRFLDLKLTGPTKRIKKLAGPQGYDAKRVRAELRAFQERVGRAADALQNLADLERFADSRGNRLQLTPPRFVKTSNPSAELEALFVRLVDSVPAKAEEAWRAPQEQLEDALDAALDIQPILVRNVAVPVPALQRPLHAPFGYQNGRFNLLLPETFRRASRTEAENKACRHAIEGRSLYENADQTLGELQLLLVADFPPGEQRVDPLRRTVFEVLAANHVRLFAVEELPTLVEEIRRTGVQPPR